MGGSSKQVTGYKYFANFLLFIGNPIEKLLGINFDNRGWLNPLVDEQGNALEVGVINKQNLYGENEGGVAGQIHARYGRANPEPVSFYADYLAENDLPSLAYPYQSYLAFTGLAFTAENTPFDLLGGLYGGGFYLGNSGYMKEMLLWPKRIHVKNDGSEQWYDLKSEIYGGDYKSDIYFDGNFPPFTADLHRCQGLDDIECVDSILTSGGGNSNLIAGIGVIGYGTQTGDPPESSTSSFRLLSSVGGFISATIMVDIKGDSQSIKAQEGSYLVSMSVELIESTTEIKTFRVNAVFNLFKSRIFGFVAIAKNAIPVENDQFVLGSRIYDQQFDGVAAWSYGGIEALDINPIHKIREILTDDTAMNKPESEVNDENFKKAADRIWDEGLGISWAITGKSCIDAINELCSHIEAGLRINRQTGLYEMILFRDDWFEEDEIHALAENKIKSIAFEVQNADEAINQLNVSYYDRSNIKNASFSVSENAAIKNANGFVNAGDVDFPYFMNQRNAAVVAQWKLKQYTTPCWKGTFTTGFYEARKWNRYDIVKINWSRKAIVDLPVRIMSINLGNGIDNTVSIEFVEVVSYSSELTSAIVIDDKIDASPLPPLACQYEPFEMPYYLAVMALGQRKVDDQLIYDSDIGLVGTVAERPQSNSLYAVMMTNNGDEWERAGSIQYSETADLDQIISRVSSSFTVKNWKRIADISTGTLIKCGSDWIGTPGEWMVFQGVDPYTGVVSVKRGALDTVPQEWGVGTKLYFCGNDVDYDSTEYISGEEVLVSALTTTPSGVLEQGGSIPIEMKSRAIRPYPPANVKINDEYYPAETSGNSIVLTWVGRNRVQQTGGNVLGFFDAGVMLESGVTYQLEVHEVDASGAETVMLNVNVGAVDTYTIDLSTTLATTVKYRIKLYSVRNLYESFQYFEHFVDSSNSQNFTFSESEFYMPDASDSVDFIM
jgi:hypothetical protein